MSVAQLYMPKKKKKVKEAKVLALSPKSDMNNAPCIYDVFPQITSKSKLCNIKI